MRQGWRLTGEPRGAAETAGALVVWREAAPAIGLSGARLHVLLVMIGYTRPQAWIDPKDEPMCYASQVELAAALGLTERTVRSHEWRAIV